MIQTIIYSIINELDVQCMSSTFNTMVGINFNNAVQDILYNFNKSTTLAFTIKDTLLYDTDPNTGIQTINTITNAIQYKQGGKDVISINLWAMYDASQEYLVKVIYHEVLHVFLAGSANSDHNKMSRDYVEPMAAALQSWFPLSNDDAMALAWGGLKDRPAWANVPEDKKTAYKGVNDRYKNLHNDYHHAYGHSMCN